MAFSPPRWRRPMFSTVLEYPLLVATIPFFRAARPSDTGRSDVWIALLFAAGIVLTWLIFRFTHLDSDTEALAFAHTALCLHRLQIQESGSPVCFFIYCVDAGVHADPARIYRRCKPHLRFAELFRRKEGPG